MMKLAVIAAVAGSTTAFAPSHQSARSLTSLFEDVAVAPPEVEEPAAPAFDKMEQIGAMAPLNFWDPLNLMEDADQEEFDRLRWVELKHGRVSMLAFLGYIVTYAGIRFPGAEDIPYGFDAVWGGQVPGMVWAQFAATTAMMEFANQDIFVGPWETNQNDMGPSPAEFKGDFRNGAFDLGWDKFDEETKIKKRTIELNNGRAAMCGILGLMVHEKLGNLDLVLPH